MAELRRRLFKWYVLAPAATLLLAAGAVLWLSNNQLQKVTDQDTVTAEKRTSGEPQKVLSRGVLELTARYVREKKPPPVESARQYAYVASTYHDVVSAGLGQQEALFAAQEVLKSLHPDVDVAAGIGAVAAEYVVSPKSPQEPANADTAKIIETYTRRMTTDKHDLAWDGKIPAGPGKWVNRTGVPPFTPQAGSWQRWVLRGGAVIASPPVHGSAEDTAELDKVRLATQNRTAQDVDDINFWGGTPGTDAPAGIWQNQLYETVKTELPVGKLEADRKYAMVQKNLAVTIADAFIECWRVKYTYWTARPSMVDPSIKLAMPDPDFPSYPSGHSTVSSAAAQVLSAMVPAHKGDWFEMATTARDSLLYAGVHYEIDNTAGFKLGELVGKQAVTVLELGPTL